MITVNVKNPISPAMKKLPKEVQDAVKKVVAETAKTVFDRIKRDTPRDRGTAAKNWKRKTKTNKSGTTSTISNNTPYINVLEYGGYPVVPASRAGGASTSGGIVRGNAVLGVGPPGPRTQRATGGSPTMRSNVSSQAPAGMVRQNLERIAQRFEFDLEEAIDKAFEDIAE